MIDIVLDYGEDGVERLLRELDPVMGSSAAGSTLAHALSPARSPQSSGVCFQSGTEASPAPDQS